MANFSTHLYGGAVVSSIGALASFSLGWSDPAATQMYFFLGVAGGLLPDIDSDNSTPVRAFFTLLGVLLGFLASFALVEKLRLVELVLIWLAVFFAIRYVLFELFTRFTVHRGIWHSLLAVVFVALLVSNLGAYWLHMTAREAWLSALFVALGYFTHLGLDEISSVNLLNSQVKRSFGTALKPFSPRAPIASALMLAATLALAYMAPSLDPLLGMHSQMTLVNDLKLKLVPDQDWFGDLIEIWR